MNTPPAEVLDLFAVPGALTLLPGGGGASYHAGDLVLSPGREESTQVWLSPVLARLAVRLDENPTRRARDLRIAMPVPARDGSWVVDGWVATRYEPEAVICDDLEVVLAAGRLLHAQLAVAVSTRPLALDQRDDQWARAERLAFGPTALMTAEAAGTSTAEAVRLAVRHLSDLPLGVDQLVHADLAGNVLLDRNGAAVIIDVSPSWRPVLWAEALAVLDSVVWLQEPLSVLTAWNSGRERQALLRALLFRAFSDQPFEPVAYESVLTTIAST